MFAIILVSSFIFVFIAFRIIMWMIDQKYHKRIESEDADNLELAKKKDPNFKAIIKRRDDGKYYTQIQRRGNRMGYDSRYGYLYNWWEMESPVAEKVKWRKVSQGINLSAVEWFENVIPERKPIDPNVSPDFEKEEDARNWGIDRLFELDKLQEIRDYRFELTV